MPEEVTRATSPLITQPTHLSSEAMRPASTDDILSAIAEAGTGPTRPTTTTRRRGRPPGSKNRTAAERLADTDPDAAAKLDEAKKREAKQARAKEIQGQIVGELNDQLMSVLIGMFNVPVDFLYQPGKGPVVEAKNDRFTELGNAFAIPPTLAKSIGKLAAELEQTETGGKVGALAQNNNVGLIVAAGMTIFGTVQYARKVSDTLGKVQPVLEARKRWLEEQANGQPQEPINDSAVATSGSVA